MYLIRKGKISAGAMLMLFGAMMVGMVILSPHHYVPDWLYPILLFVCGCATFNRGFWYIVHGSGYSNTMSLPGDKSGRRGPPL